MVTCCCEWFTIAYGLLRAIYGKINPWTIVRRFLTCQKNCLSFHGSLRVSTSCYELLRVLYGYQRAIYRCLRLTTSWRSERTRKNNPCMWRWYTLRSHKSLIYLCWVLTGHRHTHIHASHCTLKHYAAVSKTELHWKRGQLLVSRLFCFSPCNVFRRV